MPWQYEQATGLTSNDIAGVCAIGYSGHGLGINNPAMQDVPNVGPLPQGTYTIGPPHEPVDHLGPLALPLYPDPANEMHGRFGFFIHGDNAAMNKTASDGCIILPPAIRALIESSTDRVLYVVSGIKEMSNA